MGNLSEQPISKTVYSKDFFEFMEYILLPVGHIKVKRQSTIRKVGKEQHTIIESSTKLDDSLCGLGRVVDVLKRLVAVYGLPNNEYPSMLFKTGSIIIEWQTKDSIVPCGEIKNSIKLRKTTFSITYEVKNPQGYHLSLSDIKVGTDATKAGNLFNEIRAWVKEGCPPLNELSREYDN